MTAYTDDDVTALTRLLTGGICGGAGCSFHDQTPAREVLDAVAPAIVARALREAADALNDDPLAVDQYVVDWLRARAVHVARGADE